MIKSMKFFIKCRSNLMFAVFALLLSFGLMSSCGSGGGTDSNIDETIDDYDSSVACEHYCAKAFECANTNPSSDQTDTCVSNCRNSIENNCGNEHQDAANDKIEDCVDENCVGFGACMVFEAAPDCFGFVNQ